MKVSALLCRAARQPLGLTWLLLLGCHGSADEPLRDAGPDGRGRDASVEGDAALPPLPSCEAARISLRKFEIQAATEASGGGAEVSRAGYATSGWHPANVPATVLSALVADGTYGDPTVRDDLERIPSEPFAGAWWYRSEFDLPADVLAPSMRLELAGLSYRANVWLNGKKVADQADVVGSYVAHDLDVTALLLTGKNALAIEVFPANPQENLAITFHDWNPDAPDQGMGLWREVSIKPTGKLALHAAHVTSVLNAERDQATLSVGVDAINRSDAPLDSSLELSLLGHTLRQDVQLAAHETRKVRFEADAFPELSIAEPKLWWPTGYGEQALHELCISADAGGETSDRAGVRFGIRQVESELDANGHRLFRVNGKPLFVRGGGYATDLMLRQPTQARIDAELAYTLDLGLNTIRLEGKLESDAFFRRADELGILTIPGWMCCDRWEDWEAWSDEDRKVAMASTGSEAVRLGNHPSVLAFMIASDHSPPDDVATEYTKVLRDRDWSAAILPSASAEETADLPSGMKMTGPYDWVAPSYWYLDEDHGGAHGFNTEAGPGPAIAELSSLTATLTPDELERLWRDPGAVQLHAGGNDFDNIGTFAEALSARFGEPTSLVDFVQKAQLMSYEAERAPFEAYGRHKYEAATGFVHWLLNNAWPSLIWHLYDHDLSVSAGYFGAKKANEPLHVQYSYDDGSVWVLNNTQRVATGLDVRVRVLNLDGSTVFDEANTVDVGADGSASALTLPELGDVSDSYFVVLELSHQGRLVSENLYWLSTRPEIIDWEDTDYRRTGTAQFADFSALTELGQAKLDASMTSTREGSTEVTKVTLQNTGENMAFFVRLTLTKGPDGAPIWPALWQDNYISVLPGARRELTVRYASELLGDAKPSVEMQGVNVALRRL